MSYGDTTQVTVQASPVLCEPSCGRGKGPHSKLEHVWGKESLRVWQDGTRESLSQPGSREY